MILPQGGSSEPTMGETVYVSWSGGKDCYLALQKAVKQELSVTTLVTYVNEKGRCMAHGVDTVSLHHQARALGLTLKTVPLHGGNYDRAFIDVTTILKEEGITGGVFGDINLAGHRLWIENRCRRQSITPNFPLWGMEETAVVRELLAGGARLLIVALRDDLLDRKWIGQELNEQFLQSCMEKGLSPCGENGEYHTFVVDGPLFRERMNLKKGKILKQGCMLFQEIHAG